MGDTALEVAAEVLQVFGVARIDVAGEVEVEVVSGDLVVGREGGVAGDGFELFVDVDDAVEVALAQAVFVAVFEEALLASIMKMPRRAWASRLSMTRMQAGMPVP